MYALKNSQLYRPRVHLKSSDANGAILQHVLLSILARYRDSDACSKGKPNYFCARTMLELP